MINLVKRIEVSIEVSKNEVIYTNTERLSIRRFTEEDLTDLYEYMSDEEVVKFEPYCPASMDQCKSYLKHMISAEEFWAICLSESNKLIGQVYLSEKEQKTWELGYVFNKNYHQQGYASEAARALITCIFSAGKAHRIWANCNPENTSSWRLLERIGFRREGHLKKNIYFSVDKNEKPIWQDTYIYAILSNEWKI